MNKIILTSIFIVGSMISSYSQSGQKWATGGNSNTTGDFFGTTNNFPIDFKTNNVLRMSLGTNGVLKINALAGSNTRLLQVDATGNLIPLTQGASNQYLSGTGAWVNVPSVSNLWSANGTSLFYNGGYVGIGTNTPLFPLDVIGDARISNNLYVGGGIVITDKVRATGDVKTGRLEADTIKLDASKIITGETNIFGDTKLKFKLDVTGASTFNDLALFNQQVNMQSNFNALGSAYFGNNVQLNNGFTFDGAKGITYSVNNGIQTFHYGSTTGARPLGTACAAAPYSGVLNQFGGWLQIYDPLAPTTSGVLNFQTWPIGSSIDASIGAETTTGPPTALLLNYFCGNDVAICTGQYGGVVAMGKKVEMQQSLKIGWDGSPGVLDPNTSIEINQNTANAYAYKVETYNSSIKAFATQLPDGVNTFEVLGDGRTTIKTDATDAFVISTKTSNAVNFKVKNTGFVYAREMNIMIGTFPDYVFKKDYQLTPLLEVEKFIQSNNHLKGFEKASVYEKDGMPIGEVVRLQQEKIEELTLYLIELKKEINNLKNAK